MGFIDALQSMFGNKSSRDLKKIKPVVDHINQIYPTLRTLSNDELRSKVNDIRNSLAENVKSERDRIAELKQEVEKLDYDKREPLWKEIDQLEKNVTHKFDVMLDEVLPEVFACVRETAYRFANNDEIIVTANDFDRNLAAQGRDFIRIEGDQAIYSNHWVAGGNDTKWDMVHYDCQLIGGIVLHGELNAKDTNAGKIAEMATGEGKTLVATLPVFLNALTGEGVHVVTVNDYLAKRDSEWMGPLYMFHGLSVDCIDKTQPNSHERRQAYNADITFGTNNEFGFDYLRDNMATRPEDLVQRKHNFAIVDEVDSVLIDDARTPLIISGPVPRGEVQMFDQFKSNVQTVVAAQSKLVTEILNNAKKLVTSSDKKEIEEGATLLYRAYKGLPKYGPLVKFLSNEGMKTLLLQAEAKYMADNMRDMHIVTDPLYFVIDDKNRSVEFTDKGFDVLTGRLEDRNFFILPNITEELSMIEGSADSPEEKQQKKDAALADYSVKSERVHTVIQLLKAYTLFDKDVEYVIDEGKIKIVDEQTGRIMEGRRYSDGLHQAIEAKEGVKVEAATQTFATITLQNYFRMYHKLSGMTGTAETEAGEFWDIYKLDVVSIPTNRPILRNDMNDRIYRTKKAKYKAVIEEVEKMRELGRPVLVGTTSVEISELLSRMLTARHIEHNVLNAKLHQKEAEIVALAGRKGVVTIATNMAGRGTDIKLTPEVKEAGGLAIIGTERHDSRRVDRQLRGRAGRQGDPGSSVFFVSFEDDLMRRFASDSVVKLLDKMGFNEDEMIEAKMVTNSIEKAQKRVEENNFGIRKHLLEYDDVMNNQRNTIYTKRRHALMGERLGLDILDMIYDHVEIVMDAYNPSDDYEGLKMEVLKDYAVELPFSETEARKLSRSEATSMLTETILEAFKRKTEALQTNAYTVIKQLVEQQNAQGLIRVPIQAGARIYGIVCDIREAYDTECRSISKAWQKAVLLMTIDDEWKEHLLQLDQLRTSVQNAQYEQKDPLVIYKKESFNLFGEMLNEYYEKAIALLLRGQINVPSPEQEEAAREQAERMRREAEQEALAQARAERIRQEQLKSAKESYPGEDAQRQAAAGAGRQQNVTMPIVNQGPKVGRNDPCPCGSGKKYKNCHGRGL